LCGEPLRLVTPPGSVQQYSGGGYALAEVVAEDVCGRSFADIARDVALTPLGMRESDLNPTSDVLGRLATRYAEPISSDTGMQSAAVAVQPMPHWLIASTAASGLYTTPT